MSAGVDATRAMEPRFVPILALRGPTQVTTLRSGARMQVRGVEKDPAADVHHGTRR